MDYNSCKILKLINQFTNEVDIDLICNKSNIPKDDFIEILCSLKKDGYIRFVHDNYVETTNKGKTYFSNSFIHWFCNNILAIIAIVISIIALFN